LGRDPSRERPRRGQDDGAGRLLIWQGSASTILPSSGRNVDFGKGYLDRLGNRISAEDRKRVERILQEKVPCPTRLQYDQGHSEGARLLGTDRVKPAVENWPR
jgi:hypothetical protein